MVRVFATSSSRALIPLGPASITRSGWAIRTGVAISNLYHPDERDWKDNTEKLLEQCATDGISQILKEFWPDIKHKLFL